MSDENGRQRDGNTNDGTDDRIGDWKHDSTDRRVVGSDRVHAEVALPIEDVSRALAHRRRRHVLECLSRESNAVPLARVADLVTERELGEPADDLPAERYRVHVSLYHRHLPVLQEAGLVTYSQSTDELAPTTSTVALEPLLERLDGPDGGND